VRACDRACVVQAMLTDDQLQAFQYEIAVLEKLRTPFVVAFVGASHVPGASCLRACAVATCNVTCMDV
jgi:hypothetical protein